MPVNLLLLVLLLPTLLATKVFDCNNEYSNGNPFTDVIDPPIHINTWSDNADMSSSTETRSRVILVTGSTDGIGKQTALEIASARPQDTVIVHGRTQAKADAAIKYIRSKSQHGDQLQLESVIGYGNRMSGPVHRIDFMFPPLSVPSSFSRSLSFFFFFFFFLDFFIPFLCV